MTNTPALSDLLDREDCLKIMERWGGTVLRIPSPDRLPRHALKDTLGAAKAKALATANAGLRIYVPKMETASRRERDDLIREKRKAGSSIRELANEFNLSSRMIHYLCESIDQDA